MPPIEKNPVDDLLKIPLEQTLATVHHIYAMNFLIIENQAKILSQLSGRSEEEIREEFDNRLELLTRKMIDNLPKTI